VQEIGPVKLRIEGLLLLDSRRVNPAGRAVFVFELVLVLVLLLVVLFMNSQPSTEQSITTTNRATKTLLIILSRKS
jgi:hypothetical protein